MKKILKISVCTFLMSSVSAYAQDIDYGYCNDTTDKIFQLAKIPGKNMPKVFEIAEDGMLKVNDDHIKLISFNNDSTKQTYKFKSITQKKSFLRLFKNNRIEPSSIEYSFEVLRDKKGRVKSVTRTGENYSEKAEFAYSKNRCVPTRVITNDPFGGTAFVADASVCKQIMEHQKDFYKSIRKGSKCLNNLVAMYTQAEETSGKLAQKLNDEGALIDDYIQSIFVGNLLEISSRAKQLKKPLVNYAEMGEDEFIAQSKMASVISTCTDNFSSSMLNGGAVYKKNGKLKKEGRLKIKNKKDDDKVTKE